MGNCLHLLYVILVPEFACKLLLAYGFVTKYPAQAVLCRELPMAKNWIAGAIKKPGQLHKDLGVPKGEKIPKSKLTAASKEKGKVGQRARLAIVLIGLGKKGKS